MRRWRLPRGAARRGLHACLVDQLCDALVQLINSRPQLINAARNAIRHSLEPRLLRAQQDTPESAKRMIAVGTLLRGKSVRCSAGEKCRGIYTAVQSWQLWRTICKSRFLTWARAQVRREPTASSAQALRRRAVQPAHMMPRCRTGSARRRLSLPETGEACWSSGPGSGSEGWLAAPDLVTTPPAPA